MSVANIGNTTIYKETDCTLNPWKEASGTHNAPELFPRLFAGFYVPLVETPFSREIEHRLVNFSFGAYGPNGRVPPTLAARFFHKKLVHTGCVESIRERRYVLPSRRARVVEVVKSVPSGMLLGYDAAIVHSAGFHLTSAHAG